jgi:hypothetical protein
MLSATGTWSTRGRNEGLVASEPPDVQPTFIGGDSAGEIHPNASRHAACGDSTSGQPTIHTRSVCFPKGRLENVFADFPVLTNTQSVSSNWIREEKQEFHTTLLLLGFKTAGSGYIRRELRPRPLQNEHRGRIANGTSRVRFVNSVPWP